MKTTVYYDYICPFCFLATKRMEKLAEEFDLKVEWKGIEIHPEFPSKGAKVSKTFRGRQLVLDIQEMSEEDDIRITLPGMITNSRLSLEASEFAKIEGRFKEFHTSVYEAYFQNGENIGDENVIIGIGKKSGLSVEELEKCLKNRTMLKNIEENKREAEEKLVLGVPTFIFGKFSVYGVQSEESLRKIIIRAIERS